MLLIYRWCRIKPKYNIAIFFASVVNIWVTMQLLGLSSMLYFLMVIYYLGHFVLLKNDRQLTSHHCYLFAGSSNWKIVLTPVSVSVSSKYILSHSYKRHRGSQSITLRVKRTGTPTIISSSVTKFPLGGQCGHTTQPTFEKLPVFGLVMEDFWWLKIGTWRLIRKRKGKDSKRCVLRICTTSRLISEKFWSLYLYTLYFHPSSVKTTELANQCSEYL